MMKKLMVVLIGFCVFQSCGIKGKPLPPIKPEEMKTTEAKPTEVQLQTNPDDKATTAPGSGSSKSKPNPKNKPSK